MNQKPNILMLVTDDQRFDAIHALGNNQIITPNMDRLVQGGCACAEAHIQGGLTGAVCMPSRAMINTGRSLFSIDGHGQTIDATHTTIGELLRANGYKSFGTGKWHNGPPAYSRSFDSGENAFFSGMWDHWNVPVCGYDPTGAYDNVVNFVVDFYHGNRVLRLPCDAIHPGVHSSDLIADSTVRFLDSQQDAQQPFFCYSAFLAPHDPRTMPSQYLDMYDVDSIELPPNCRNTYPFAYAECDIRDERLIPYPRTEEAMRHELRGYYAMVTHLDHAIGRILAALENNGQLENTLVVLMGDNGLSMGCHGFMGKQNVYEHAVRVPLVLMGPGIPRGTTNDSLLYLYDVYPTLCEYLGIEVPASVEGKSFLQQCLGSTAPHRETLYHAYGASSRAYREGDDKVLVNIAPDGEQTSMLFDLAHDPLEMHPVKDDQKREYLLQQMRKEAVPMGDFGRTQGKEFWDRF